MLAPRSFLAPLLLALSARATNVCNLQTQQQQQNPTTRTYAMIKPDVAGDREKVDLIKKRIQKAGLVIVREQRDQLSKHTCAQFYAEHQEREFFDSLVNFMSSGPVLKLELAGDNAVQQWRQLIGPTNSARAREEAPETLRALFGTDGQRNAAHGSDSAESAEREINLMFDDQGDG